MLCFFKYGCRVLRYLLAKGICPPQPEIGSAIMADGVFPLSISSCKSSIASSAYATPVLNGLLLAFGNGKVIIPLGVPLPPLPLCL